MPEPCTPDDGLNHRIIQVCRAHRGLAGVLLGEVGLFPGQEVILMHLWGRDGQSQSHLAEKMGVQPPTVTKMLQRLEASGLVERRGSPQDSRVSLVYLSEKGKALEGPVAQVWERLEARTLAGLSAEEVGALKGLLSRVQQNLAGAAEDA